MTNISRRLEARWLAGLLLILILSFGPGASAQQEQLKIRLLSNEAADACIKDMGCMRRLFLAATLGEPAAAGDGAERLFKWTAAARLAAFAGEGLPADRRALIDRTLEQMSLIAKTAGVDIGTADGDDVVNVVLLVSGDFERDRDAAFADFLSSVFADGRAIYDELRAGPAPVCASRTFANDEAVIGGGLAMAESDSEAPALQRCIHRTALQMLGLRRELPAEVDSVLSPASERDAWTSIDYVLLKLLYDPRIQPGMGRDALQGVFPDVYESAIQPAS